MNLQAEEEMQQKLVREAHRQVNAIVHGTNVRVQVYTEVAVFVWRFFFRSELALFGRADRHFVENDSERRGKEQENSKNPVLLNHILRKDFDNNIRN